MTDRPVVIQQDGHVIQKFKTCYRIDGIRYDRISAVLDVIAKPGLDAWEQKHGPEKAAQLLQEAGDTGTLVHALVERVDRGEVPWPGFLYEDSDGFWWIQVQGGQLDPYYRAYCLWRPQHVRQTILAERVIWSEVYGYAGTFDKLDELLTGEIALLDVKSSGYLSWTYRLQTAAYVIAVLEHQHLVPDIDVRGIVHMSSKKLGTCRLVPYRGELEQAKSRWLSALDVYQGSMEWADDWKY